MALPAAQIDNATPQTTGTLATTVLRLRVKGFSAVEITADTAAALYSLTPGSTVTGGTAPSGVQANGIADGAGRVIMNPRPGENFDLLLWGNGSVVDIQGVP